MTVTVKTVSVTYGRKFNLGDFNSATVDCTLWADVSDDQDLDTAMRGLWEMAKANVKEQALPLVAKQTAKAEAAFLGLPLELREAAATNGHSEPIAEWVYDAAASPQTKAPICCDRGFFVAYPRRYHSK